MTPSNPQTRLRETSQLQPWYRYPWPWVAIAIPAIAVVGGFFTLYLAITNPDPLIVDEQQYREIRADLQADPESESARPATDLERDHGDGEN
jgi:hypothetical protein